MPQDQKNRRVKVDQALRGDTLKAQIQHLLWMFSYTGRGIHPESLVRRGLSEGCYFTPPTVFVMCKESSDAEAVLIGSTYQEHL